MSRLIADLNNPTVPASSFDPLAPPTNLDQDLSLFTENDFIDWNAGSEFDPNSALDLNFDLDHKNIGGASTIDTRAANSGASEANMNFGNFEFADPLGFSVDTSMQAFSHTQNSAFPSSHNFNSPVNSSVSPITPGFDHLNGKKRKLDLVDLEDTHSEQHLDEPARVAAEEDKRRRNTAASARFRVKKKQREQALEKTAKEMTDRVNVLETRIQQLETENTWLKGLITEKSGEKSSSSEVSDLLRKHIEQNTAERSRNGHTDGVGTKSEETKA